MHIMNIKRTDKKYKAVSEIIESILECADTSYIEEIYAKDGVFDVNQNLTNWVALMIELSPNFVNNDLYETISVLESTNSNFDLILSTEPNMAGRGHGTVLWERGA